MDPPQPPTIVVGTQGWQWRPDNPLGGSIAWSRALIGRRAWDEEALTTHEFRYQAPAGVSDAFLRKAAKRACKAARKALARRGSVIAHGSAAPHAGALELRLRVEIRSAEPRAENREACARIFDETFRRALQAEPSLK